MLADFCADLWPAFIRSCYEERGLEKFEASPSCKLTDLPIRIFHYEQLFSLTMNVFAPLVSIESEKRKKVYVFLDQFTSEAVSAFAQTIQNLKTDQ